MSTTTTAPAGWYPNPEDAMTLRWWTGVSWSEELAPLTPSPVPDTLRPAESNQHEQELLPAFDTMPSLAFSRDAPAVAPVPLPFIAAPSTANAYSPMRSTYISPTASMSLQHQSPNTVWIWLLAFSPYIAGIVGGVAQVLFLTLGVAVLGASFSPQSLGLAGFIVGLFPLWIFAGLDIRALRLRGYQTTSILFMLLIPPLAYFIARGRRLMRDSAKSRGPELALFIVIVANIIIGLVAGLGSAALLSSYR